MLINTSSLKTGVDSGAYYIPYTYAQCHKSSIYEQLVGSIPTNSTLHVYLNVKQDGKGSSEIQTITPEAVNQLVPSSAYRVRHLKQRLDISLRRYSFIAHISGWRITKAWGGNSLFTQVSGVQLSSGVRGLTI